MNKRKRGTFGYFRAILVSKPPLKKRKEFEAVRLPSFPASMSGLQQLNFSLESFSFSSLFFDVRKHNVCAICYYGQAEQISLPTRVGEPACLALVHNWWTCCCVFDPAVWYVMPPALKPAERSCGSAILPVLDDTTAGFLFFFPMLPPCFTPGRLLAGRWNANRRILNRITDSDSVALARCRWHYRGIAPESGKSNQAVTLPEGWRSSDCGMIHSNFLWSGRVMLRLPFGKRRQTEKTELRRGWRHGAGVMQRQ